LRLEIVSLFAAKPTLKTCFCFILFLCSVLLSQKASAQYTVHGTVLDSSRTYPLPSVSVEATNGAGTSTDANGNYQLNVGPKDSIWFSYLGKPTRKFPVEKITNLNQFDIALQRSIPVLPELKIRPRNYRQDSLQNREDYAKIFNFHKPNVESLTSIGPNGAGIDIDELIRVFQFKKNKSTLRFQQRLLQQEQDKFIDHRFNKLLVRRLTGLDGEALDRFMQLFRPSFEFAAYSSEYQFQLYIKESAIKFKQGATGPTF
jgi:CarboxypepD_reg-like domain